MAYKKITEADLRNKGITGLPDTPGLTTEDMQSKFEEVARDVIIPAFNLLIDALTADMNNIYTKEEVANAIREKVVAIGTGDMAMHIYDKDGDGIVDRARQLAQNVKIGNASFNGTAGITVAEMGAAASEHSHTKAHITDFPSSIKNPKSLIVQFNGEEKTVYEGSAEKILNITAPGIGAVPKSAFEFDSETSTLNITL